MSLDLAITQCTDCGKVIQQNVRNLCPACIAEEDGQYRLLERTMVRNRMFNNEEAAEATSIPVEKIRSWIRGGKFRIAEYPNLADQCDLCKEPTRKGHLCYACATKIKNDIAETMERERQSRNRTLGANAYISRR